MPGLLRGMARTAVVAGTATATANAVNRRQAQRNVAAYEQAGQQVYAQQPPPGRMVVPQQIPPGTPNIGMVVPPPPQARAPQENAIDDKLAQLERLGQLKAQGILTEEEFSAQKAVILG